MMSVSSEIRIGVHILFLDLIKIIDTIMLEFLKTFK